MYSEKAIEGTIEISDLLVPCTYKVIGPGMVQIGSDQEPAVDASVAGDLVIPEEVELDGQQYCVVRIGRFAFGGRCGLTSTGLEENRSVSEFGRGCFAGCKGLRETGLVHRPTSLEVPFNCFDRCLNLSAESVRDLFRRGCSPVDIDADTLEAFVPHLEGRRTPHDLMLAIRLSEVGMSRQGIAAATHKGLKWREMVLRRVRNREKDLAVGETFSGDIWAGWRTWCCTLEVTAPGEAKVTKVLLFDTPLSDEIQNGFDLPQLVAWEDRSYVVTSSDGVVFEGRVRFVPLEPTDSWYSARPRAVHAFKAPIVAGGRMWPCEYVVTGPGQAAIAPYSHRWPAVPDDIEGDLEIPRMVTWNGRDYEVTGIGKDAFMECEGITGTGLAKNSSITHVDEGAFFCCVNLRETGLDGNGVVTSLGDYCFGACQSLVSTGLEGNSTVASLGWGCFSDCVSLESTGLSACTSVSVIGAECFRGCASLTATGLEGRTSPIEIGGEAFGGTRLPLVAHGDIVAALNGIGGSIFRARLVVDGRESVGIYALAGIGVVLLGACQERDARTVSIPDVITFEGKSFTVVGVRKNCFAGFKSLEETGLAANTSVKSLGDESYRGCVSLRDTGLAENSSVTEIGKYCFAGCRALTDTGLAENTTVTKLGYGCFQDCKSLRRAGLAQNASIEFQDKACFAGCYRVEE